MGSAQNIFAAVFQILLNFGRIVRQMQLGAFFIYLLHAGIQLAVFEVMHILRIIQQLWQCFLIGWQVACLHCKIQIAVFLRQPFGKNNGTKVFAFICAFDS